MSSVTSSLVPPATAERGPVAMRRTACPPSSTATAKQSPSGAMLTRSVRVPRRRRVSTSGPEPPAAERLPRRRGDRRGAVGRQRRGGRAGQRGDDGGGDGVRVRGVPLRKMLGEEAGVRVAGEK